MKLSVKYSPSLLINFFHNLPPSLSLLFDLFLFDLLYTLNILSLLAPLSPPPLILLLQQIPPIAKNKPRQINHMQSPAIYLQNLIKSAICSREGAHPGSLGNWFGAARWHCASPSRGRQPGQNGRRRDSAICDTRRLIADSSLRSRT